MTLNRTRTLMGLAAILVGTLVMISSIQVSGATKPDPEHKVTICHRTNSNTNPYVQITVDEAAVDGKGGADHYGEHQGPVWNPSLKDNKIEWGDIIPPVAPYHNGLNWTEEGQAIYNDGCEISTDEETTTTTEAPTTTTEAPTTTVPETTTTVPSVTTTVPVTSTVPGVSTTVPSAPTTVLVPTTVRPDDTVIPPTVITRGDHLARTGTTTWPMVWVGLGLIAAGGLMVRRSGLAVA